MIKFFSLAIPPQYFLKAKIKLAKFCFSLETIYPTKKPQHETAAKELFRLARRRLSIDFQNLDKLAMDKITFRDFAGIFRISRIVA